jgi:hypothetical protein
MNYYYKQTALDKLRTLRYNITKNMNDMDLENVTLRNEMQEIVNDICTRLDNAENYISAINIYG